MRLGLIFSNDWELFGDGSGDYWEIQHRRLRQLLDVAAQFDARITVMAEVAQQWAHRRLAARESWAREISEAWESILVAAVREESDVQLHLHPHWLDARRRDGKWQLDFERWALSSLGRREIVDALREGKKYLESLLRPVRPAYRSVLFRAGAFCIEPAVNAIGALAEAGFLADTSVTKGLYDPRYYDYRRAPSHVLPWEVDTMSTARTGQHSGIVELPILSTRIWDSPLLRKCSNWHYTRWLTKDDRVYLRDRTAFVESQYPSARRPAALVGRGLARRVARFAGSALRRHWVSLDYDVLPAGVFVDCVERLFDDPELASVADDVIVPVMALGHSKLVPDADNFGRVLSQLRSRLGEHVVFWTGQEAAEYWSARLTSSAARAQAA
jgi:hypothetical protein